LIADPDQRAAQPGRQIIAGRSRGGLEKTDGAVGARHAKPVLDEFDILLCDLKHRGGDLEAFLVDLVRGLGDHPRAEPHRTR
jgi:hypothetical protein